MAGIRAIEHHSTFDLFRRDFQQNLNKAFIIIFF